MTVWPTFIPLWLLVWLTTSQGEVGPASQWDEKAKSATKFFYGRFLLNHL